MTANEIIQTLQELSPGDRNKRVVLIGRVSSDKKTRGIAEFSHVERTDDLVLLVSNEAFEVRT